MSAKLIAARSSHNKATALEQARKGLTENVFEYHRIGYDRRLMTFLADGTIGQGAKGRERHWNLRSRGKKVVLEIASAHEVTCRLTSNADQRWTGRWVCCERMPIELSPVDTRRTSAGKLVLSSLPKSLFIVSLPRSLSTLVYHCAKNVMGLREPVWTSSGEILNVDRFVLYQGSTHDTHKKFLTILSDSETFGAAIEFLDQVLLPRGFAYKDVIQPFMVTQWLKLQNTPVLHIRRNIADVAYAMIKRKWYYPARLFSRVRNVEIALVRGLIEADLALSSIVAQRIDFDELIVHEKPLEQALQLLYPRSKISAVRFIDAHFKQMRAEILARRQTALHQRLSRHVMEYSSLGSQNTGPKAC